MSIPFVATVFLLVVIGVGFLPFRKIRIIGAILLLAGICTASYALALEHRYAGKFPLIKTGDSQQRVLELLGNPSSIIHSVDKAHLFWAPIKIRPRVAEEYNYHCLYAPRIWVISFDKDRNVIHGAELNSP